MEYICRNRGGVELKYEFNRICIYCAYLIVILSVFFAQIGLPFDLFNPKLIIFGLIVLTINLKRINKVELYLWLFFGISVIVMRWLPIWVVFMLAYRIYQYKIPIYNLALLGLVSSTLLFILSLFLLGFDVTLEQHGIANKAGEYLEIRSLGFVNTNTLGLFILRWSLLLYLICMNSTKKMLLCCLIIVIVNYTIFKICGSRTSFYASFFLIILYIALKLDLFKKNFRYIIACLPILFFGLSLYFSINYEENQEIRDTTTGRTYLIGLMINQLSPKEIIYGRNLFEEYNLDNTYICMLILGGVIYLSFFLISFYRSIIKYYNPYKKYLPFILTMLLAGVTENTCVYPADTTIILWYLILNLYFNKFKHIKERRKLTYLIS